MPRRQQRRLPLSSRIKDGRIYKQNGRSRRGIIYLICQKHSCFGTAKIVNGEIQTINAHAEHCYIDPLAESIAQFKDAIRAALRTHWYKLKELYESLAAVYPEAAEHVSYHSLRSSMKKWSKSLYPPSPRWIRDFVQRVADPEFERNLEYGNTGRLSVRLVTDAGGNHHAVLFDENFVNTEMRDVSRIFIDGTFRATPRIEDASQLVTIMGVKFNYGFPFVWIVMSRKTESAYVAVLRYVKENAMGHNQVRLAMTDFERGLRNAIGLVWDEAHVTGCNTHYDRAVIHKAKSLGLRNLLQQSDEARLFFKKILALAYLPANLVERQYVILKNSLSANLRRRLSAFCTYYARYWLRIVRPEGFSVYGLGRRTNNVIESYHSRLGHRMERSPVPWDFLGKLLKLAADVKGNVRRLRNNCQISRHARYSTIFKQNRLTKAWRELHMHEITVDEFLEKAAALKGDVSQMIAAELDSRQGPEYDLQEPPVVAIGLEEDPDYEPELFAADAPHWLLDNAEVLTPITS